MSKCKGEGAVCSLMQSRDQVTLWKREPQTETERTVFLGDMQPIFGDLNSKGQYIAGTDHSLDEWEMAN